MTHTAELVAVRPEIASLTLTELKDRWNASAPLVGKPTVNKFSDRATGLKRLDALFTEIEQLAPKKVQEANGRKKRQKVFSYPPLDVLKDIVPGSLRAQGRDLLLGGATLKQVEALIVAFDAARDKTAHRVEERAYGLVRLLHTYIGYALREEGSGDAKKIFVMTREAWSAWRAKGGN